LLLTERFYGKEFPMDGINAAQSAEVLNQLLQNMSAKQIETAEKMVKVSLEMSLGAELGKGGAIDIVA